MPPPRRCLCPPLASLVLAEMVLAAMVVPLPPAGARAEGPASPVPVGWAACLPRQPVAAERLRPGEPLEATLPDGRLVRLAGLAPPPAGSGAAFALLALIEVRLAAGAASIEAVGPADRWDRTPVLAAIGGQPVAALLVRDGVARVRPDETPATCLRQLLRLEEEARRARRGMWAGPEGVLEAGAMAGRADLNGRFTIFEGRVTGLGRGRVNIYLNFGTIPRHDVSVTIQRRSLQRLEASGMTWTSLEGRRVRIRGVVTGTGRPSVAVVRPEEIERLD